MNDITFLMSINQAIEACKDCNLYKGERSSNAARKVVMPVITSISDYSKYVNDLQTKGEYDILLQDDSMFQFEKGKKEIIENKRKIKYDYYRYCFIQSPTRRMSFQEYCQGFEESEISTNEEYFREMYEHDNDMVNNNFPFYLRYDVDYKGYKANCHSYAHLHIGFQEGYRMPVSIILTPKAFVCMTLKLAYSDAWRDEIVTHSDIKERIYSALKSQCLNEKNPYWLVEETKDIFLG